MLKKIQSLVKQSDIISEEIKFRIQRGNSNFKTTFGGVISILSYLLILASVIFFMEKFFNRKESTIISNEILSNDVTISNFSNLPFMIRISDNNAIVQKNSAAYWKFFYSFWWTEKNLTDPNQALSKKSERIELSKCDFNNPIHFNEEYKMLFSNITDIHTYFCPNFTKNMSLYGIYGDISPYSYFHFSLRQCINEIDDFICAPAAQLKSYMSNVYFDFLTVNYMIDSHSIIPYKPVIHGERFLVSNSLYRRIWMNYKRVFYESDFGYIFEQKKTDLFFQIDNFASDINLNLPSGIVPNTILGMTISNLKKTVIITRYFTKVQQFLANVGGIIKGLSLIAFLINYMISTKLCNLYLINHLPEIKYLINNGDDIHNISAKKINFKEIKKQVLELNSEANVNSSKKISKMKINSNLDLNNDVSRMKIVNADVSNIRKRSLDDFNNTKLNKEFIQNLENINKNDLILVNNNPNNEVLESEEFKHNKTLVFERELNIKLPAFEKYIDTSLIKQKFEIELSWYQLIIPDFLLLENDKLKYYKKSLDYLIQEMDVSNIINKLNQFEKLKQSSMTYDQLNLFNFLFQNQNKNDKNTDLLIYKHQINFQDFEKSYEGIKAKKEKNNLDEYLMSIIKD